MSYFILNGVPIKVLKPANLDLQLRNSSLVPATGKGSVIRRLGSKGKKTDITIKAKGNDVKKIVKLAESTKPMPLVSKSAAPYNCKVLMDKCVIEEKNNGVYYVHTSLHEYNKPAVKSKKFKNYTVKKKRVTVNPLATGSFASKLMQMPTLKKGKGSKSQVKVLQKALKANGFTVKVTGKFDQKTKLAVQKFQKSVGLKPTGIVDDKTKVKFNTPLVKALQGPWGPVIGQDVWQTGSTIFNTK